MVTQTNAQLCYTLTRFLGVAIHTLLHHRRCYPSTSFILARAYGHPVRQSRHPEVCRWIEQAVDAVYAELLSGTLARAALVICNARNGAPLERFVFDFGGMPRIPADDAETLFMREGQEVELEDDEAEVDPRPPEQLDVSESFRAVLSKLSSLGGRLGAIPAACTFTLAVDLRDEADIEALNGRDYYDADDGEVHYDEPFLPEDKDLAREEAVDKSKFNPDDTHRTQPWILARPDRPGRRGSSRDDDGDDQVRVVPIRSVAAGELVFEMWAEERPGAKEEALRAPPVVKGKRKAGAGSDEAKQEVDDKTGDSKQSSAQKSTEEDSSAEKRLEQEPKVEVLVEAEAVAERTETETQTQAPAASGAAKRVRFASVDED